ncbi:MAG TPA: GNAT family N-acetyltransferase [Nevskiaceae bacterium]|nr:GNAT family N-acetyltransferase [Nevskiaceae bacterium]
MSAPRSVTTWYLEQRHPGARRPARLPQPLPLLMRAEPPSPAFSRFLYTAVGGDWYWRDRLGWSEARWQAYLADPAIQTWVAYVAGTPAGYVELARQPLEGGAPGETQVEIAYFGLLPAFIGRGLGGWLLDQGLIAAWAQQPQRVWVHTCSLDGPAALANYQARGLELYRSETREIADPGPPDGPWPGARSV